MFYTHSHTHKRLRGNIVIKNNWRNTKLLSKCSRKENVNVSFDFGAFSLHQQQLKWKTEMVNSMGTGFIRDAPTNHHPCSFCTHSQHIDRERRLRMRWTRNLIFSNFKLQWRRALSAATQFSLKFSRKAGDYICIVDALFYATEAFYLHFYFVIMWRTTNVLTYT